MGASFFFIGTEDPDPEDESIFHKKGADHPPSPGPSKGFGGQREIRTSFVLNNSSYSALNVRM